MQLRQTIRHETTWLVGMERALTCMEGSSGLIYFLECHDKAGRG